MILAKKNYHVLNTMVGFALVAGVIVFLIIRNSALETTRKLNFEPRSSIDTSGFYEILPMMNPWRPDSLEEIANSWRRAGHKVIRKIDSALAGPDVSDDRKIEFLILKAQMYCYEAEPAKAYQTLVKARSIVEADNVLAERHLYTIIFFQGVTGLRRGEDENCILCRGESSCILPIARSAVHVNPAGSRLAIKHFGEYLDCFPNDLEVRWLFNLARMTLGEYPGKVPPKYLVSLDRFLDNEFDIGKFRDVGHLVGLNRLSQCGGAIMEDFDNDGLLDVAVTSWHPTTSMALYRNNGNGTFTERTRDACLADQKGGLYCVQTDYDNDGWMDIFIPRGAWVELPMRPSLLKNQRDGTFLDVTKKAGLLDSVNSISASWADYDNDGFLDLFICCDLQPNRLYRNQGDGTFKELAAAAGLRPGKRTNCKGAAWFDYNNDDFPDLFLNHFRGTGQLFKNNRDGTFTDVSKTMGINGPRARGFSCWAWDYDNDGWLDLFATSYAYSLEDIVNGLLGRPHKQESSMLFRNLNGTGFADVTREVGLDAAFATMGSNYGDFDNDGLLDMYLGTGEPNFATLVPNRMFKNVAGKRFSEITASAGTGHLQKGHGVACGDWDRDGDVDIFIQMGGAVNGDKYHDILFQNPGQGNNWLTLKLIGKKTNRAAIGARIKVITDDNPALTLYRHVSSGSSFGGNPLEQTIGLAKAERIAVLEIHWPTSGATQVFRNIQANQTIAVVEFAEDYRKLKRSVVALPK